MQSFKRNCACAKFGSKKAQVALGGRKESGREFLFAVGSKQHAFSLLEVVIVAGLMSVLSLGLTRIVVNQTKTVKTTESKLEVINAVDSIRALLADRETCWVTFIT